MSASARRLDALVARLDEHGRSGRGPVERDGGDMPPADTSS